MADPLGDALDTKAAENVMGPLVTELKRRIVAISNDPAALLAIDPNTLSLMVSAYALARIARTVS